MSISEKTQHLPDFMKTGWEAEIGEHTFTPEEIINFAKAYDPQPFHVSEELAENSLFGGLCASGWHTASMWMRKQRDYTTEQSKIRAELGLPLAEFGPSPGFINLKWHRPVFSGDTITYFNSTDVSRRSKSKPDWHILTGRQFAKNQNDGLVLSFQSSVFLKYPA